MQQIEPTAALGGAQRQRVETVMETLAALSSQGETLAEVAHDARNMVAALWLYCDLLEEPGVLAAPFLHYGNELRLVAAASRRLVERLEALDIASASTAGSSLGVLLNPGRSPADAKTTAWLEGCKSAPFWNMEKMQAVPIESLADELRANRNLLAALAGPAIALTVDAEGGAQSVRLTGEDLTRVLVNLVKNAAEAMPKGGRIQLGLRERVMEADAARWLSLTVEDNGPGVPSDEPDRIFDSGYTTRGKGAWGEEDWTATHRGLGLAISRSIIGAAGGRIHASNRSPAGARLEIELPVRNH